MRRVATWDPCELEDPRSFALCPFAPYAPAACTAAARGGYDPTNPAWVGDSGSPGSWITTVDGTEDSVHREVAARLGYSQGAGLARMHTWQVRGLHSCTHGTGEGTGGV